MAYKSIIGATCAALTVVSINADAALHSRLGGQAYYDDVADLTWLADANAAGTTMTWDAANAWAAGLDVSGVTGWRLADTIQPDAGCSLTDVNGQDYGNGCTGSELGNLFYNVLGGVATVDIATTHNANYDLFSNVQSSRYWSATEYVPNTVGAWLFYMNLGYQDTYLKSSSFSAWAVQSGDVGDFTSIIGSWYVYETPSAVEPIAAGGPIVVTFMANGQYVIGQDGDPAFDPSGTDGMEWGTYSYDGTTLSWNGGLDTSGDWGLGASGSVPVTVIGDVLTFDGTTPVARVNSPSIIGGWQVDGTADDQTIVLTIIDGTNFMLNHGNNPTDPTGQAGIEYGTYTWDDVTDAFAFTIAIDTNGEFGLSHSGFNTLALSGDTLTVSVGGANPETLTRITGTALTIDTTPDALTFTDMTDVDLDTPVSSEILNITGIDTSTYISITGGEYSLNSGTFTSVAGTVSNNDTLQLQTTSSVDNFITTDVVVSVGTGGGDTWSVTTLTDTIPDAFSFTDQNDLATNITVTSDTVIITGLGASSPISITGGEYSINGGAYTSTGGFINNNDTVTLQTTSSSVRLTSVDVVLSIGGVSDTFTATAGLPDNTPNAFTFYDLTNVNINTMMSRSIQVSGINVETPISVSGGEYSIDGGAWASASGTVNAFNRVRVRHTSAATGDTTVITTLTIGEISASFSSTTHTVDTTPNAFTFYDRTYVDLNTSTVSSTSILVTGVNEPAPISISGGEYSIDGGAWTSASGTVNVFNRVRVRHTSAATDNATVTTTLTIGDVVASFSSTTKTVDTTPNAFNFYDRTGAHLNWLYNSTNSIQVSGINEPASISVIGGEYSIDGGAWTSASGTVNTFSRVLLRQTSAATGSTQRNTVLTIGGISATFSVTTKAEFAADTTPNQFSYYDRTGAQLNRLFNSTNSIQVSGTNAPAPISITGGEYSIDGGAWTSVSGTVNTFSRVLLRQTSSSSNNIQTDAVLTIGGISATFSVTTKP